MEKESEGPFFDPSVTPAHRRNPRRRAVLVGSVWSADLAESLLDIYGPWIDEGATLEGVSRWLQGAPDEGPGD